jgi:uncharacterized protein
MKDHSVLTADGDDLLIRVKAVPGASRDALGGALGDRLKVRVSAPAEAGKANKAICAVIARAMGVKAGAVSIESGRTSAEKVVRVRGRGPAEAREALGVGKRP